MLTCLTSDLKKKKSSWREREREQLPKGQDESKGPEEMGEDGIQGSSSSHGRGAQGPLSASFLIGIAIEMIMGVLNFPPESMVPRHGPQQHVCRAITIQYIQIENLEMSTIVSEYMPSSVRLSTAVWSWQLPIAACAYCTYSPIRRTVALDLLNFTSFLAVEKL